MTGEGDRKLNGNLQSSAENFTLTMTKGSPKSQLELSMPKEMWAFLNEYYSENIQNALKGKVVITKQSDPEKVLLESDDLSNLESRNLEALPSKLGICLDYACFSDQWSHEQIAIFNSWLKWKNKIEVIKREKNDDGKGNYCIIGKSRDVSHAIKDLKSANYALEKKRIPADSLQDFTTAGKYVPSLSLKIISRTSTSVPLIISEPQVLYFHKMSPSNKSLAIICHEGDLLKQKVDIIICPSSVTPQFTKGMARKIKDALMYNIEAKMLKTSIPPTESVVEEACKLKCDRVMFVSMPHMKECKSEQEGQQKLTTTIINCLNRADELKASSIAMPALGSG